MAVLFQFWGGVLKKFVGKSLKALFIGLSSLLLLAAVALLWVVYHPHLIVNPSTLQWAAKIAEKEGVVLRWEQVETEAGSISFFKKDFSVRFQEICLDVPGEDAFHACFEKAAFRFEVDFSGLIPVITTLGEAMLAGGRATIVSSESQQAGIAVVETPPVPAEGFIAEWIPGFLQKAALGAISVEFDSLNLLLGNEVYEARAGLKNRDAVIHEMVWDLRVSELESPYLERGSAQFVLSNVPGNWAGGWRLRGRVSGVVPGGGYLKADLRADQIAPHSLRYEAAGDYAEERRTIVARIKGLVAPSELRVEMLSADFDHWLSGVKRLSLDRCKVLAAPEVLTVDCPVIFSLRSPPRLAGISEFTVPLAPSVRVRANLKTAFPPDPANPAEGLVQIDLEPSSTRFLSGEAKIKARLAGVPVEFPREWRLDTDVDAKLRLREFHSLVVALSGTDWAVPAPLNTLDGEALLSVTGRASLEEGRVPLVFQTRMESKHQKLDIDAQGILSFNAESFRQGAENGLSPHLDLAVALTDVKLVLPRLQLRAPPRVLADPRIRRAGAPPVASFESDSGGPSLTYRITLQTPEDKPLRLVSNLARRPVPVSVKLVLSEDEKPRGTIRIADFPLELFRRDASVQHIAFGFSPESEKTRLDGVLRVNYADYRVRVLLLGTLEEPRIQLTSDPPLPERQLLSVLLFGRPLEELDPLESESVGSARAALADSALNLASLYFLAATPIESFGYDPNTGLFSAKVRLGEGTSLNLGAEAGELSQIGIRRRLSRFWTITTTVGASQGQDSAVMAFLEWVNRY